MNDWHNTVVAIFIEGNFESVVAKLSEEYAKGFAEGLGEGASYYGAGSIGAYVLPRDEKDMFEFEMPEAAQKAKAALKLLCGES